MSKFFLESFKYFMSPRAKSTQYLATRVAVGLLLSLLQHPVLFPWLYSSSSLPAQAVNWTSKWLVKKKMNQNKTKPPLKT